MLSGCWRPWLYGCRSCNLPAARPAFGVAADGRHQSAEGNKRGRDAASPLYGAEFSVRSHDGSLIAGAPTGFGYLFAGHPDSGLSMRGP